jgi:hypothetical protein
MRTEGAATTLWMKMVELAGIRDTAWEGETSFIVRIPPGYRHLEAGASGNRGEGAGTDRPVAVSSRGNDPDKPIVARKARYVSGAASGAEATPCEERREGGQNESRRSYSVAGWLR